MASLTANKCSPVNGDFFMKSPQNVIVGISVVFKLQHSVKLSPSNSERRHPKIIFASEKNKTKKS